MQKIQDRRLFNHVMARDYWSMRHRLDWGAAPDIRNSQNNTPLHLAAVNLDQKMCEILLEGGADVNAAGQQGNTPLHMLFCERNPDEDGNVPEPSGSIIELFVSWGANPAAANDRGVIPLDLVPEDQRALFPRTFSLRPGIPERLRAMLRKRPPVPGL